VLRPRRCALASLKRTPLRADSADMFNPRQRPLLLVADRLLGLRLSLNTPVVATAELPAGPARAAIVMYSEGGKRRFAVAVRALRSGTSVVYELEGEDLNEDTGWAVALDAALSFGESMGFLFDDEELPERSPGALRQALAGVREIIAPPGPAEEDRADPELALEEPAEETEILLDDAVEAEAQPGAKRGARGGDVATAERGRAGVSLTKFRAAPVGAAPAKRPNPAAAGAAKLGRVRPVRLRSADSQPPIGALLRLLAAF
jgi:hypothetical protein